MRKQGFALDRGEHEKDVRCIACPIRNHQERVVAAVSMSAPAFRIDVSKQNHLKEALIETSNEISRKFVSLDRKKMNRIDLQERG